MSGQLHVPAALPSGKGPQAFIKYAGSAPKTRGDRRDAVSFGELQRTVVVPAAVCSGLVSNIQRHDICS